MKDHVTLNTEVMTAENSVLLSQEKNKTLKYITVKWKMVILNWINISQYNLFY